MDLSGEGDLRRQHLETTRLQPGAAPLDTRTQQGLVPELDALLEDVQKRRQMLGEGATPELVAQKAPEPRVCVVQGSFDWPHQGHLGLIEAVAQSELPDPRGGGTVRPFDLVLVVPTYRYDRKPFLVESFGRRSALLREAVNGAPELRGKVAVSDLSRKVEGAPADIIRSLTDAYPTVHFAYALGADSFAESAKWPGFDRLPAGLELIAVCRKGHPEPDASRASHVLPGPDLEISSTEIRRALTSGRLESLEGRLPDASLRALAREREAPGSTHPDAAAELSRRFASLNNSAPAGAIELTRFLEPALLSGPLGEHLADVQERYQRQLSDTTRLSFKVDPASAGPDTQGYTPRLLLEATLDGRPAGRYLFKRLPSDVALKVECLTVLANVFGLETPIATRFTRPSTDPYAPPDTGVVLKWKEGVETVPSYDFSKATPGVIEDLMVSRWFNELIGNQDVWWGQFLVPTDERSRYEQVTNIDFDNAFLRRDAGWVQTVLREHFGIVATPDETSWTDREFRFDEPLGWAPGHYDSAFTFYGSLLTALFKSAPGENAVQMDFEAIRSRLRRMQEIPSATVLNALEPYLQEAWMKNAGYIPVPGAGVEMGRVEFERAFSSRISASFKQFEGFVDELEAATRNPSHPMAEHYRNLGGRTI